MNKFIFVHEVWNVTVEYFTTWYLMIFLNFLFPNQKIIPKLNIFELL